jgi:hypothetical protein
MLVESNQRCRLGRRKTPIAERKDHKRVESGRLGVKIQPVTEEVAAAPYCAAPGETLGLCSVIIWFIKTIRPI